MLLTGDELLQVHLCLLLGLHVQHQEPCGRGGVRGGPAPGRGGERGHSPVSMGAAARTSSQLLLK